MNPIFFPSPAEFKKWLLANHDKLREQWIGFHKKGTGLHSISWPESVDQALCFGWIDGLRKRIDEESYMIRFTPRKKDSYWSKVNIDRVAELKKLGLMELPGLEAFSHRKPEKSKQASYEQKELKLDPNFEKLLRLNKSAWCNFNNKAPSYRKQCIWWVMSAKKQETRQRRMNQLIESSHKKELIAPLKWTEKK
ncbi:MAG: YdeI/OmpD-associated family protein [Bacteroidetes bacterium]|nr:YdeI/OmpD-associated family protein [Bacteroidota bacterium]MDA1120219.1 YdeI/OmpD-associated family protein [Bacteroidota bacterium]